MNLGHVEWCMGNRTGAVDLYRKSILQKDNSFDAFMTVFKDDKIHLEAHGITGEDIIVVLDHLKYELEKD